MTDGHSNQSLIGDAKFLTQVYDDVCQILRELVMRANLKSSQLLVIGCSTSEVIGEQIGKSGATEVAEQIFRAVLAIRNEHPFTPVFQCCEHLNRALVMEKEVAIANGYEEVSVIPVDRAGGAMAAYAFRNLHNVCVVEQVRADAALDIGDTLIGMHLRPVAVPFRPSLRSIGHAHVTAAFTRPKLIGGARAVYE